MKNKKFKECYIHFMRLLRKTANDGLWDDDIKRINSCVHVSAASLGIEDGEAIERIFIGYCIDALETFKLEPK